MFSCWAYPSFHLDSSICHFTFSSIIFAIFLVIEIHRGPQASTELKDIVCKCLCNRIKNHYPFCVSIAFIAAATPSYSPSFSCYLLPFCFSCLGFFSTGLTNRTFISEIKSLSNFTTVRLRCARISSSQKKEKREDHVKWMINIATTMKTLTTTSTKFVHI